MATFVLVHGGDRARAEGRFREIDAGHDLMITEPEAVAAVLEEIATCSSSS
jgi:hypothetical protein